MRDELTKGNKSIFSEELYYSIEKNLMKKQTILFFKIEEDTLPLFLADNVDM